MSEDIELNNNKEQKKTSSPLPKRGRPKTPIKDKKLRRREYARRAREGMLRRKFLISGFFVEKETGSKYENILKSFSSKSEMFTTLIDFYEENN